MTISVLDGTEFIPLPSKSAACHNAFAPTKINQCVCIMMVVKSNFVAFFLSKVTIYFVTEYSILWVATKASELDSTKIAEVSQMHWNFSYLHTESKCSQMSLAWVASSMLIQYMITSNQVSALVLSHLTSDKVPHSKPGRASCHGILLVSIIFPVGWMFIIVRHQRSGFVIPEYSFKF